MSHNERLNKLEEKFDNNLIKIAELEKKISDIDKLIDNRDIIPKGWAKSIDGYSKLKKQIEDAKRQLEKLGSKPLDRQSEKKENPYLALGIITVKNGELHDYNPSQFVRDYAKTHTLFSLHGLVFPEEGSGREKGQMLVAGTKQPVRGVDNMSTLHSKLPEFVCSLELQGECGNEGSMDCLKGNSKGERFDNNVCVHGKKELEKRPEPKWCDTCEERLSCVFYTAGEKCTKPKTEPEKKYPKVVYQLGSDSKEYIELKKKYDELIEGFKDKLEFLRDKVLEAPILSGSVQDLRDHIHDLKDLVIKNINEYEGLLNK